MTNPIPEGKLISVGTLQSNEAYTSHLPTLPDTQFAFGLTFPTPGIFYTTAGSPPFIPDAITPTNTNEPYIDVSFLYLPFGSKGWC